MAQYARVLAAEPDNLSSIPGTHVMEGEYQLLKVVQHIHTVRGILLSGERTQ